MPLSANTKEQREDARKQLQDIAQGRRLANGTLFPTHDERTRAAATLLNDILMEDMNS